MASWQGRSRQRMMAGTAYVEYFLLAAAMVAAVLGLMARAGSMLGPLNGSFNRQLNQLAGPVAIP